MNTTAQVTSFFVLLASLLGLGVLINNEADIDTNVNTVEEARLPFTYEGDGLTDIVGFSLRYPRGWEVEALDGRSFEMSRPVKMMERDGAKHVFTLTFEQAEGDDLVEPGNYLGMANAEVVEMAYPAARAVQGTDDAVAIMEVIRLNDENIFLRVSSATPLDNAVSEDILAELDNSLASITIAEDFGLIGKVFTYQLPETWSIDNENAFTFVAYTPAGDPAAAQGFLQVGAFSTEDSVLILGNALQFPPDINPAEAQTALEMMGLLEGVENELIVEPLHEVTYFGQSGLEVGFTSTSQVYSVTVLDTQDGFNVLIIKASLVDADRAALVAEMDEIINGIQYQTPHPSLYEQPQP